MIRIEWLTIASPLVPVRRGFDRGRSSWKLHAVRLEDHQQKFSDIPKGTKTVCGLSPAWGFDLCVPSTGRCKRCQRILGRVPIKTR
jgi:hypothetical protein